MGDTYDFLVRRDDLHQTRVEATPAAEEIALEPGQILLRIDNFSITANNVTYGLMGDAIGYWGFFPAPDGWGIVPAWGYAEVVRSECERVEEGARVFGFLPMSTHVVMTPGEFTDPGFDDVSPHRAELPAVYNRYGYATPEGGDTPEREPYVALFAPLFFTSFLLADEMEEEGFFGAERFVLSSASSKTALALAYLLNRDHGDAGELVGLTSPGNAAFVESTGYYDRVITYEDLENLDPAVPTAYIDFAGRGDLRARAHRHFGEGLSRSVTVGATNWDRLAPDDDEPLPGPDPVFFFAPSRVEKRNVDWGAGELRRRVAADQALFVESSLAWLTIRQAKGPEAIGTTYRAFLEGAVDPGDGWSATP